MVGRNEARRLYATLHYAKANGLVSRHDAAHHCRAILMRVAAETHAPMRLLEAAFRLTYRMDPCDFMRGR